MKFKDFILITLFFLLSINVNSQASKIHYLPPISANDLVGDQWIYISTSSKDPVVFEIKYPNGDLFYSSEVSNDVPIIHQVGNDISPVVLAQNLYSTILNNSGLIIEAEDDIYVSLRMNSQGSQFQAGTIVSKGDEAFGKKFYTGNFNHTTNSHHSFVSMMASEDNTTINISIPTNKTTILGQTGTVQITLNKYESYLINSQGVNNDLKATYIESDKPIVVQSGSASGSFGQVGGQDYGMDQLVGIEKIGNEYILVQGERGNNENLGIENILIIATEDGTVVNINESPQNLQKGQTLLLEGENYRNNTIYLNSNEDIYVYQGLGKKYTISPGAPDANQGMFIVPALSCSTRGNVDNIPSIQYIGNKTFEGGAVMIVTKTDATIKLNGKPLNTNNFSQLETNTVFYNQDYITYRIKDLRGNISVKGDDELYVSYVTYGGAATSGGFYSGFSRDPVFEIDLQLEQLGSCIGEDGSSNVTLTAISCENFDSLEWQYKDNGTFSSIANVSDSFMPDKPGEYRLKGTITIENTTDEFYSNIIPISICPFDSDEDGIIDNIDLDLDNDGILNSLESAGDGIIDFTNISTPAVQVNNGNTSSITTTGTLAKSSESHSISVSSVENSSFESQIIEGDENGKIEYSLNFSEDINIEIKNDASIQTAIKAEEYFSINVYPVNQNITVLNDDNSLIIDTDYNNSFENNVSRFTSNVINFKFNPDFTGTKSYVFLASKIEGLKFTHNYNGSTGESVIIQSYIIKDISLDTDGDGIDDYLDPDSDNDFCDDIIEAGFEYENFVGDPDDDGKIGESSPYEDGDVNDRGLYIGHDYEIEPKKDANGNYLYQTVGQAASIDNQPSSATACIGSNIEFEVSASATEGVLNYQWQFFDNDLWTNLINDDTFEGIDSSKLTIKDVDESHSGNYRVLVNTDLYLCETPSNDNITLTVNAAPENPSGQVIQTFCQSTTPKISSLTIDNLGSNTLYWYDSIDSTDPIDLNVELEHNKFYYAELVDSQGCVSTSRFETKAFISNPILNSSQNEICLSDSVTLTIDNVAKTAADFASENDLIFITNNGEAVSWDTEYGKTYFMIQANTGKDGFFPIDWPVAKNITDNYNSGDSNSSARMYVVLNAEMEKAVHDGLVSMELTGSNGIAFWLGLYQDINDPDYQEPGNESQNWGGWKWVNGKYLKDTGYTNWWTNEPNNAGGNEHHGQFEFSNNGIKWNDMSVGDTAGQSWPLFEYTGSTDIIWGYYDKDGNEVEFENQPGTGSIDVSPEETTTYFVKVFTNNIPCVATKTIVVNPDPVINQIPDYVFCDDDTDGDSNNSSITLKEDDFKVLNSSILGGMDDQELENFNVTYYTSIEDAESDLNAIEFPFTSPQKDSSLPHWENKVTEVFVRILNKSTGCVNFDKAFNLVVNPLPITFEVDDIILCDDDYDEEVSGFDLESRTNDLRSGNQITDPNDIDNQSSDNFKVTYHLSESDANNLEKDGLSSPYKSGSTTIYYRIQEFTNTGDPICYKTGEAFDLIVNKLPVAKTNFINVEQCDDGKGSENDGETLHNLTESQSLFSDNYENEFFEYYRDEALTQKIENPKNYKNVAFNDKVYLKIINQNGCEIVSKTPGGTDRLSINITVGASEISENFIEENNTEYSVCEDSDASNQDEKAVFSSEILTDVYNKLINSNPKFNDQKIKVTLHTNSEEGLTGENPIDIDSDFTTLTPKTQEIWARVVNVDITEFTCLGYEQVATLYVEPKPIANAVVIDRKCDGDSPDDMDSSDGKYPFDVSLIEEKVIDGQTGVSVSYFYKNGDEIQNFGQSLFLTESTEIIIIVEKEPSYPNINNPDGLCHDETLLEFIVDDAPEIYPLDLPVNNDTGNKKIVIPAQCDDGPDDTDGFSEFDTSKITSSILGPDQSLNDFEISYSYRDEKGNLLSSTELRNPFNTKTQTVIATLTNKLNSSCASIVEIDFIVNLLPEFTVDDETIVCLNLPPISIGVTSFKNDYEYSWTHKTSNGEVNAFPPNNSECPDNSCILVGTGGIYSVTAIDKDTGCERTLSINVKESNIAAVTLNDIIVSDLTSDNNNTITVDTTNLGIGDYEFSIDNPSGPYQDNPYFEQVRPGIHTIYIRDKNSCGTAQIDVSVIGYKKFFTPNNDGIHDSWKVLGIRKDFQPNSKVFIFDRYGKLLKELDPLSEGWDGTYIGKPMPQSDYWFRVYLEDGREFSGHFSLVRGF